MQDTTLLSIALMGTFGVFLIFLLSYLKDRRRLRIGLLFNFFLICLGITFMIGSVVTNSFWFKIPFILSLVLFVLVAIFGLYALIFILIRNGRKLVKREGKSFHNMLSLLLAIALIAYPLILWIFTTGAEKGMIPGFLATFVRVMSLLSFYFLFSVFNFLMSSFLYRFNRPKYIQDYIIVLGSGLIDNKVPPLLGSRIDKAIDFYHKQIEKTGKIPKIIFSGGRGDDEKIPESVGMKNYALEKGIPSEHLLTEENSRNTLQNMRFSKDIMFQDFGSQDFHSIFTTNDFHLFRAGIYARLAELDSQGIGSKTPFYFWLNAMIREYIALIVMYKKQHTTVILITTLIALLSAIAA
ncbi:YdcF family protein [Vagococcus humatus]|nr:YdcF family protein [Vagococcus humatus]